MGAKDIRFEAPKYAGSAMGGPRKGAWRRVLEVLAYIVRAVARAYSEYREGDVFYMIYSEPLYREDTRPVLPVPPYYRER